MKSLLIFITGLIIGVMYGCSYLEYKTKNNYETKMSELKIRKTQLEIDILKKTTGVK